MENILRDALLTPNQVSEKLNVSLITLQYWRTNGGGPEFIKYGIRKNSPIRYKESKVDEWIESKSKIVDDLSILDVH